MFSLESEQERGERREERGPYQSDLVRVSSGSQAKPNTTEVNRPQLDQLERLTISFIRSHVGSITYFLGRDPLPLKEPLITGFLFDVDLIPQNVTTATSSK